MAKKYQKAKGGASSLTVKIVAIVLMLVMICAIVFSVLQFCMPSGRGIKPSEWFGGTTTEQPKDPDEDREDLIADENGGLAISQDKKPNGAARLSATKIAEEDYEENGVSPQAETAVTISIIDIEPANATELLADWSAKFLTEGNEEFAAWAEGKEVSDYVTVTPAEDTLSAVVECTAPFGAQIEVQAQFRTGDKVTLSCVCDYVKSESAVQDFELTLLKNGEETDTICIDDGLDYKTGVKLKSVGTKRKNNSISYNLNSQHLWGYLNSTMFSNHHIAELDETTTIDRHFGYAYQSFKLSHNNLSGFFSDNNPHIDALKECCGAWSNYCSIMSQGKSKGYHLYLKVEGVTLASGGTISFDKANPLRKEICLDFSTLKIDVSNANFDKTHVDFNA